MDLSQILEPVLGFLGTVIGLLAAYLLKKIADKVKGDYINGVLSRAIKAVEEAVLSVKQSYVDQMKADTQDGKWTKVEKARAKARAIEEAKSYLGAKGLAELVKILGLDSLDGFLGGLVESAVGKVSLSESKKEEASPIPL